MYTQNKIINLKTSKFFKFIEVSEEVSSFSKALILNNVFVHLCQLNYKTSIL